MIINKNFNNFNKDNWNELVKSNKAFSKVNTTINYSKSKGGWIVNDGGESPSTNGTWIMLRHSFELNDGCEFKTITNSKFKIEFAQKSKIISVNNNNIE